MVEYDVFESKGTKIPKQVILNRVVTHGAPPRVVMHGAPPLKSKCVKWFQQCIKIQVHKMVTKSNNSQLVQNLRLKKKLYEYYVIRQNGHAQKKASCMYTKWTSLRCCAQL